MRDADYIANKYALISFDIFDTLIKRNVMAPGDIFDITESKYNTVCSPPISDYRKRRLDARDAAIKKYEKAAVTIDEIYSCLSYPEAVRHTLKQLELETELEYCSPNIDIRPFYTRLCSLKCPIVLISDMYLPSQVIKKLLDKCGIIGYTKIYVSCEYGCSKSDLRLFKIVCRDHGISPNDLFHVGDNWNTDFFKPLMSGISSRHIMPEKRNDYFDARHFSGPEKLLYSCISKTICNHLYQCGDEFERLGYEVYGPLLYGFCTWLKKSLQERGIQKIFFLAREGAILKQVFEQLEMKSPLKSVYFYGSRRSLVFPSLWLHSSYDSFARSMVLSCRATVQDLFDKICLPVKDYQTELKTCGLSENTAINGHDLLHNQPLCRLYELIKHDIAEKSHTEYITLEKYLRNIDFSGNVAIADIGWNGSMQKALQRLPYVEKNVSRLEGYYLGINGSLLGKLPNAHGYIYDAGRGMMNRYLIYGFSGPFELALTALHGSTSHYEASGAQIKPVLLQNEYINADGSHTKEYRSIKSVQKGILAFVKDIKKMPSIANTTWSSEVAFRNCLLFGQSPLKKHLDLYRDYTEYDGTTPYTLTSSRYRHFSGSCSFQKGFWHSTWKIGFMKDFFKLPLPYYKLYIKLKQWEERKKQK